jgi:hypothetical protein
VSSVLPSNLFASLCGPETATTTVDRLPELAADLVRRRVTLIATPFVRNALPI